MALTFSYPDVSAHADFKDHETVLRAEDASIGFVAYIAIHSTKRGPARGGCRYWSNYLGPNEAIGDVLRLSHGMTMKTALANLEYGGGKTVIMGKPGTANPSPQVMEALGHMLNELGGIYETGEDVGTRTDDFKIAGRVSDHVRVRSVERAGAIDLPGGPPLYTAHGLFSSIRAAVYHKIKQSHFKGTRVAVKGLGNVGSSLCEFLHREGAKLVVSDLDDNKTEFARENYGAEVVSSDDIISQDVDVFAPCALGGDITPDSIKILKAPIICGAANNQLIHPDMAEILHRKGVLYAPDYAANAGGVINVVMVGATHQEVLDRAYDVGETVLDIFERSEADNLNTVRVAEQIVQERLDNPQIDQAMIA